MVLTLDFGLSLANADPVQPISRIIPAANIAIFFTLLSLTRPKASLSKDCTGGEADAQSSDECTERGEIIHLFAVYYGVAGPIFTACLEANARRRVKMCRTSGAWNILLLLVPVLVHWARMPPRRRFKKRRLREVSGE